MIYNVANTAMQGRRMSVFVNGNKVRMAVFADTERGVVRYQPSPARITRKGEIHTRVLRGRVTVEPID